MSLATLVNKAAKQAPQPASKGPANGLRIGEPDDALEREADRFAEEITTRGKSAVGWSLSQINVTPPLQRQCDCGKPDCEECAKKKELQRKATGGAAPVQHAPPVVHQVLRGQGRPMSKELRGFFEPRFRFDFSRVRIHYGAQAAESAKAVGAQAYTVGENVVFGEGRWSPDTPEGRRLIAHELAHVVQQSGTLQRAPGDPQQHPKSQCISPDGIDDGDGIEIDPAVQNKGSGQMVDFAILGKPKTGDTFAALSARMFAAFVEDRYGSLSTDKKDAIRAKLDFFLLHHYSGVKTLDPGCAFAMFLASNVTDQLYQISGIEIRTQRQAREKKEKQEKKEAGQHAEQREAKAGLPPPPDKNASTFENAKEHNANTASLPAKMKGPELQPVHGTGTYTMELSYWPAGNDLLSQVTEAMNWVDYHWERFDITDMVMKGLTPQGNKRLKQQEQNNDAEVGKMAAAGRRVSYAYEDLKQETVDSASDLAHPTQNATTGSATEVVTKAIANYENLTLLPASAIVKAGGLALGALADLMGGTSQEREIPWPDKAGYYMVRCIAQPAPQGKNGEQQRAASVAVKTVEVRSLDKLAKNALLGADADIAETQLALDLAKKKDPPDPKEIDRLNKKLGDQQLTASGPATEVIKQKIEEKEKERETASDYKKAKLDDEIRVLMDQGILAEKRAKGMTKGSLRPRASLVSTVAGATYPLLLQLGEVDPTTQKYAFDLSDVTSRDGAIYHGEADTQQAAAWNAVKDFAYHNEYGEGVIAIAMPDGAPFQFHEPTIPSEKHDTAIAKARINDLIEILVILGMLVPGVGEAAMVLGAAVAAAHLLQRWENGTLRFDEALVGDLIAILAAVLTGVSAIGELKVVRTSKNFMLKAATVAGEAAETANEVMNYGGMIWGTLQDLDEIMSDRDAELRGDISHAEARRNRANKIAHAVETGALVFGSHEPGNEGEGKAGAGKVEMEPEDIQAGKSKAKPDDDTAKQKDPTPAKADPEAQKQSDPNAGKAHEPGEVTDPNDPVAKSGKPHDSVDVDHEKTEAHVTTADGLHKVFVLEDGRIIRCSLSCGELRSHYQDFIESAMKDPDPERQKLARDLDSKLKTAELGAKSENPAEKQAAAKDAAAIEPELRKLAAKDLSKETGVSQPRMEKLSNNFTPDEIRTLNNELGPKALAKLADGVKVRTTLSHALEAAGLDPAIRDSLIRIVKEGLANEAVGANELADALAGLGKLQDKAGGYVPPDFLAEYEAALKKGDVAAAKSLLKAAETRAIGAKTKDVHEAKKAALKEKLDPLEKQYAGEQKEANSRRAEEARVSREIAKARADMKAATDREIKEKTPEAKTKAREEAREARKRLDAAEAEQEGLPSSHEADEAAAQTREAMNDARLQLDPESRAPLPCFATGTPVWTSQGTKPIETLQPGDGVLAFDFAARRVVERTVRQVYRKRSDHFFRIAAGGLEIHATGRHRFWTKDTHDWVPAAELKAGMMLQTRDNGVVQLDQIQLEESAGAVSETWNLSIDENPNYFVGPGLLVHNSGGFDSKLGGTITIYRGTNPKYPGQVYIGKTIDESDGGKARGVEERQGEHQEWARKKLADQSKLSEKDAKFYEFMSEVTLDELVTGLATPEQGQYLEQKNIEIEREQLGEDKVMNRRNEITSPEHMKKVEESIRKDPKVQAAGFCTK